MTRWTVLAPVIVLLLLVTACASPMSRESSSGGPRLRCLDESPRSPEPSGGISTRPLFFFFCIQSP